MNNELDPTDFDAVIGYYNIGSLDRQQEISDRAVTPEHFAHIARVAAFKADRGPDPGPWQGAPIDFERALLELEEEEPYDPEAADDDCRRALAGPINCHGQNVIDNDRAEEIRDCAMTPEGHKFLEDFVKNEAGRGPDPGKYKRPVIDFEKAAQELEEEEPEWTSLSENMWEERQREREAQHPVLHGKRETHLCRGARDFQLMIFIASDLSDTNR